MRVNLNVHGLLLAAWGFTGGQILTAQNATPTDFAAPAFREDRILVMPKATRLAATTTLHSQLGAKVLRRFPDVGGLQSVSVPAGESVQGLIAKYQASGTVVYAEPDFARTLDLTPNDPQYANGTAWGLYNFGQSGGVADADIDAAEGWDVLASASNIVVAIIDSGIRKTHEDLSLNVWTNASGGYGWNALQDNETPTDGDGHGSMMAGVIGAVGNNGKGGAGVAWRVRLLACRSFASAASGFDSDIIEGLEFARTNGAQIINMSLGGAGFSSSLSNAIFAARESGIIVVASSGNEGVNVDVSLRFPACYQIDNIISVAASTRADALWSSSNYGATNVDLAAPGQQITSTFAFTDSQYLTLTGGSSFSAAYVSGACALLRAKYPTETHQQLIARVLSGADPLPALAGKCVTGGRLNLRKALSPPVYLTFHSMLNFMGQATAQWRVTAGPMRNFVVEASTNLTTWAAVYGGTTSTAGTADFFDPLATNHPQRFYRVVAEP